VNFGRVRAGEWFVALAGAALLAGLIMPWTGEESAFVEVGALDVFLGLTGIVALVLPLVVAASRKTDVPIVTETLLATAGLLAAVLLLIRLVFPPNGGLDSGFFLGLAGIVLLEIAGWKSVARES